ncbi:ComF family protein [Ohessyouella blattaphilus]|uniref:ComF family protein n=1 Tax=Ohessyouella blattaphilus TaxID=2949333 RepID=UPI003EBBA545
MKNISKLLWPTTCPFCFQANRTGICAACKVRLVALEIRESGCALCSKELSDEENELCCDCQRDGRYFDGGTALWRHELPVSKSLYYFKYKNMRFPVGDYVGNLLCRKERILKEWCVDMIVPVPLSQKRRKKRGYNQSELIARRLGERMGIPVKEIAKRTKETRPQRTLDRKRRKRNVAEVFEVTEEVKDKRILIIDDIYTTGATIDELSQEMKKRGASKVYFLTVSIGQGN